MTRQPTNPNTDDAGVAVVTGGASGIGLALARALADRGAHVLIADIDEPAMRRACDTLAAAGARVDHTFVDLRDAESVARLAETAWELGRLDAVCLNAGVTSAGAPVWETAPGAFDFVVDVNLRGLFHSIRAFVPRLIAAARPADIVITASMAGMVASPYSGGYAASKAGAVALAKALRAELQQAAPQLRLALLNPGMVKTNLIRTSAAGLPAAAAMSQEMVSGGHDALNQAGVEPDEAVSWALRALDEGRFWALPSADDPFLEMLAAELKELGHDVAAG